MSYYSKQNEAKLHILQSLARSQRALARMIEALADIQSERARSLFSDARSDRPSSAGGGPPGLDRQLAESIKAIAACQKVLAFKMTGVRVNRIRRSRPGKIWLNRSIVSCAKQEG
ncbi:hypothetical protein [Paenibacillus contaminans]|uniref:Uncharacterized protein n=1 Tax=Paenibacillus contaminans TaxID=450362 RepID=A0A329MQ92_9BACL|nr:hypothetical protein [Paenibacillus contaminans]RAV22065.1 hypothetical protein DQG23_08510 [Paenibacillus contaminans]